MNKKKKQFGFLLREDLRARLEARCLKFGTTISHQINRAIEFQLGRDEEVEKGIKLNNTIYGPSNPPEDLGETIKEFVK